MYKLDFDILYIDAGIRINIMEALGMHNIVYITDDNYILPTKASINSIIQSVTDKDICINVIAVEVSDKNRHALKKLENKNIKINILNFTNEYVDLGLDHHYVSKTALFKFQLPIIFKDLDRILYLDGDMVLFPSFIELFDFDISEKYAAVVQDMLVCSMGFDKKINHAKYFNSGMMFLNLKKMREDNIPEKLIEYKKNDSDKSFMDQNALNVVIGENSLWVNPKYNMIATCSPATIATLFDTSNPIQKMASFYEISEDDMLSAWQHPSVLHLAGEIKTWKNISAERIEDWISCVLPEDSLWVSKNYCLSLKTEFEKQKSELLIKLNDLSSKVLNHHEQIVSHHEQIVSHHEQIASQQKQIVNMQQQLSNTYNLLINTRHRTLYGMFEWLFRKIFRRGS